MQLFRKLLKKKELSELDLELKKYNKKQRIHLKDLLIQYEKGMVLIPNKDIDNKQLILERA